MRASQPTIVFFISISAGLFIKIENFNVKLILFFFFLFFLFFYFQAIKESVIPPTINYETPDPECDLDYVPNKAIKHEIKVAVTDNLGFGGHNAALVFKKYEPSKK